MQVQTLSILLNHCSDNSVIDQKGKLDLFSFILEINQKVVTNGLSILEEYETDAYKIPILSRGISLIRKGIDPDTIESILLNMAIINHIDLLTSLLVLEGTLSIQILRPPHVTKELLLSFFGLDYIDYIDRESDKSGLQINRMDPLSTEEIHTLIDGVNGDGVNSVEQGVRT